MVGALLIAALVAQRVEPALPGRAIYSDVCTEPQSGDLAGHLVVFQQERGVRVRFVWTEGSLKEPVNADGVSYDPQSHLLRFSASTASGPAIFRGRITATGLTGNLKDGWEQRASPVRLARIDRLPTAYPPCRPAPSVGRPKS